MVPGMIEAVKNANGPVVVFATKAGGKGASNWLEIAYPEQAKPTLLLEELADVGWTTEGALQPLIPLDGIDTTVLHCPGSGLFRGWTTTERRSFMAKARRVLRRHGFEDVGVYRMQPRDMM